MTDTFLNNFSDSEIKKLLPASFSLPHIIPNKDSHPKEIFRLSKSEFYQTDFATCEYPYKPISKTINYSDENI